MAIQRCKIQDAWVDGLFVNFQYVEMVMYADHAAEVERLRAECRLLWTALTNEVSVDRIKALSTAVELARDALEQK
jgi:hypothetical protein